MIVGLLAWAGLCGAQTLPVTQPTTAAASQPATAPSTQAVDDAAVANYQTSYDAATKELKTNDAALANAGPDPAIMQALPNQVAELTTRLSEDGARLNPAPSLDVLGQMQRDWADIESRLSTWRDQTQHRLDDLSKLDASLIRLLTTWKPIRDKVAGDPDRAADVDKLINQITKQRERVLVPNRQLRDLIGRLDDQLDRTKAFQVRLNDAQSQALSNLFTRDCPPFWRITQQPPAQSLAMQNYDSLRNQWARLKAYLYDHSDSVWLHVTLIVIISLCTRWMSRRSDQWTIRDADGAWYLSVLKLPMATGLALSLLAASWIYPGAVPRLWWVIIGAASLLPLYLLLRRALEPRIRPLVRLFMALWLVNNVLELMPSSDVLTRTLMLLECSIAALYLSYYAARALLPVENETPQGNRRRIFTVMVVRFSITVLIVSILTNLFGLFALSRLLTRWLLTAAFIAMIVRAGTRVLIALMIGALHVWPLDELRMVREYRPTVQKRLQWIFSLAGVWLWAFVTLGALSIRPQVAQGIDYVLGGNIPGIQISLRDILQFAAVVFASFMISRFVRFLLKEDIYPRIKLARGVPYAISTLLHYSILLIGLWLAFAALEVDRTKFTILASAFGVGIGFGLQNVVNNFVSGLLLLFERPVQVGDVVELEGGYIGSVSTIGIRASIVRTTDAAEVIVPNSLLISNRVINWTFSTRQRGFTLPVTIVGVPDPNKVLDAMLDAAAATRLVLQSPRPQAYLVEFSPAVGTKFEMRVWTAQFEDWVAARSDLAVNLTKTLAKAGIQIK